MRIKRRIKRSTRQYIIVAVICIVVIGGAALLTSIVIAGQISEKYQSLLKEAYHEMEINQRIVYIAEKDIVSGELITEDMLRKEKVYTSQPQKTFIRAEQIGKLALVNIPAGTHILTSMVTDYLISSEIREVEYDVINMNSNMIYNDTVDVRIFFPNGESYVVLSKKVIKEYSQDIATVFLWLDEEELLRMSAAIVDAALYKGSKLYVTKYIEPNIQDASVITYTPSLSILSLIEDDPNIVERCSQELNKDVRKALENRMADSMETDVASIQWYVNSDQTVPTTIQPSKQSSRQEGDKAVEQKVIEQKATEQKAIEQNEMKDDELGSSGYFYYAEEALAKERDIEYGE